MQTGILQGNLAVTTGMDLMGPRIPRQTVVVAMEGRRTGQLLGTLPISSHLTITPGRSLLKNHNNNHYDTPLATSFLFNSIRCLSALVYSSFKVSPSVLVNTIHIFPHDMRLQPFSLENKRLLNVEYLLLLSHN